MSSFQLLVGFCIGITFAIETIVDTTYGPIQGEATPLIRQFLSVPYAAPSNTTRWQPPQSHKQWTSTLKTTDIPPGCPQRCTSSVPNICPKVTNEDCLYLNIFTPLSDDYTSTNYPVIFYIHGGGFKENYGYGIRMNTTYNVNKTETIYVTINYRLGALGFLWDESIGITGNYGYMDQVYALEWTYNNIKHFGGDPESIIIDGESAGAMSVAFHLTNVTSKIIKGGIMESCVNGGRAYPTPNSWGNKPMQFEASVGCNITNNDERLKCMMNADVNQIVKHQYDNNGYIWWPTVKSSDGLFSDQPTTLYQQGKTLNVPFIIGNNEKELGLGCGNNKSVSYSKLQESLTNSIGKDNANKVLGFYNVSSICGGNNGNCVNISCQISTDMEVKCISRNMTASSSIAHPNTNYYEYEFDHGSSFNPQIYGNDYCWNTPCHTAELWYVFYSPQAMKEQLNITFEGNEVVLAGQIDSYWTNFAKTPFDPNKKRNNDEKIIEWLPYKDNDKEILLFDVDNKYRMAKNYDIQVCQFWDSLNWSWLKTDIDYQS